LRALHRRNMMALDYRAICFFGNYLGLHYKRF
jgi:hypothetical protein